MDRTLKSRSLLYLKSGNIFVVNMAGMIIDLTMNCDFNNPAIAQKKMIGWFALKLKGLSRPFQAGSQFFIVSILDSNPGIAAELQNQLIISGRHGFSGNGQRRFWLGYPLSYRCLNRG